MRVVLSVILCLSLLLDTTWTAPSTSDIKSDSDDSGHTRLRLAPPKEVQSGETVQLPCNYELNGTLLHSVKWYRNDQEIFRYVPKELQPFKVFPLPGLHIDLDQTDERMVSLLKVDRHSTGTYKCEATVFYFPNTFNHSINHHIVGDFSDLTAPLVEVKIGETARLPCNNKLYGVVPDSVKWYKNDQEFFRYVPKEVPPLKVFPLPGLHIDFAQTDERMVTLLKVDNHSNGIYKCELTVNSPNFLSYDNSTQLRVVRDDSGHTRLRLAPPKEVQSGETVRLPCNYELNGTVLHSVKWYRNDQEFYRYVPKEVPPLKVFPLPGLHIDLARTDERKVTLLNFNHNSTGTYKCEVSMNSPYTYIQAELLRVMDVPVGEPDISAVKLRDASGEQIQVISTAPPSNPAANLTGPLNDRLVPTSGGR